MLLFYGFLRSFFSMVLVNPRSTFPDFVAVKTHQSFCETFVLTGNKGGIGDQALTFWRDGESFCTRWQI